MNAKIYIFKGVIDLNPEEFGPEPDGTIVTPSGKIVSATIGIYYEDYFFNGSCAIQVYLELSIIINLLI